MKKIFLSPIWSLLLLGALAWLYSANPNFIESLRKISWLNDSFIKVIDINVERFVYPLREMGFEKNVSKILCKRIG